MELTNAIEIRGLTKHYKGFSLENLNLDLPAGCVLGLVGENGAGKSTTIRLTMDALERDGGTVTVLGVDNKSREFHAIKEDIGVVLDEAFFPEIMTSRDIGRVMAATYRRWDAAAYARRLKDFGLKENQPFKEFSRGMKMKLAIATALSHAPRLLILDEATSGLDPVVRDEMLDVFRDFAQEDGHAVLMSSHIVSDLEKVCDYIACLHKGKLLLCQEKDRLMEDFAVARLTQETFSALPPTAVHGAKHTPYYIEALVDRAALPTQIRPEHASLEDILLLLVKKEA